MTSEVAPRITLQCLSGDVNNIWIGDMSHAMQGSSNESPAKDEQAAQEVRTYAVMTMPRNFQEERLQPHVRHASRPHLFLTGSRFPSIFFLSIKE